MPDRLRIWHQSMTEIDAFPAYRDALATHLERVVGDVARVELHGVAPGTYAGTPPVDALNYPFAFHTLLAQVLGNVRRAEQDGFDAVVLASWAEPFLVEARSAVDIPVVSMAESTLLTACSVAPLSALITVTPEIGWMARTIIERHRLSPRVAGIFVLDPPVTEPTIAAAFDDPGPLVASFRAAAQRAIDAHADVLIPAEGILTEVFAAHGLTDIDGVSVMDGVAVAFEHAVLMCRLRARTGLHAGRRWAYRRPPPELMQRLLDAPPPS